MGARCIGGRVAAWRCGLVLLLASTTVLHGAERIAAATSPTPTPASRDPLDAQPDVGPLATITQRSSYKPPLAAKSMPAALVNVEGLSNADNIAAGVGSLTPAYANGDIGPSHYVQVTHSRVRVFDRLGAPLTASFRMSTLFAGLGPGHPCADGDDGNPIALYDALADRWLLSQSGSANFTAPFYQCIAVSQSGDPTAAWYAYGFENPYGAYSSFARFGVAGGAYVMAAEQYASPSFSYAGVAVFAFERERMLRGHANPRVVSVNADPDLSRAVPPLWPADLDGPPPDVARPALLVALESVEYGGDIDAVRLFELTPDFDTPSATTFTELPAVAVAAFDPVDTIARGDIPQPGTANLLDAAAAVGPGRVQYRQRNGVERLAFGFTVDVSGDPSAAVYRAGIRTQVLRRTLPGGPWGVEEQFTFPGADGTHRWVPSVALDRFGHLAVGYNVSNPATVFPSIGHAGRLATDPPDSLFQGASILHLGSASQTSGNRWGEIGAMAVDPVDDCTYWQTNQYMSASVAGCSGACWRTRIAAFRFPDCDGTTVTGSIEGTIVRSGDNAPIIGARIVTPTGYSASSGSAGTYRMSVYGGDHDLAVTADGYEAASAVGVAVTTGNSTTRHFALVPLQAIIFADGFEER